MTKINKKVSSYKNAFIDIKTRVTKPRTEALFSPIIFVYNVVFIVLVYNVISFKIKIDRSFYAPNFEKVGSILVSACPFVRPFVRSKQNSS